VQFCVTFLYAIARGNLPIARRFATDIVRW
jgi:hypothetical protein